ncbi:hypothetical protein LMG29739_05686 [Paraburkholderia solisilvae]|uniref:Uncharacterized protein n=1 Tax=Paraburkholderia solisilvae TaxID=624376 RepID=A0A6J5EXP8_9BURK|nr:hypothetical protein LMG29739_05686 [Paraburkholderia solisilvae]
MVSIRAEEGWMAVEGEPAGIELEILFARCTLDADIVFPAASC